MDDERLLRKLGQIDSLGEPDPAFLERMYRELREEIGFSPPGGVRTAPSARTRRRTGVRRWWPVLGLAAAIAAGVIGSVGVGALRDRALVDEPPTTLLAAIRNAGHITVAIRPDHPQFSTGGDSAAGFDVDVARELARRLGVVPDIIITSPDTMIADAAQGSWDVALPSVPDWTIDSSRFLLSDPYYYWPHLLVVADTSTATRIRDLSPGPVCAVSGDGGEAWLRGRYGSSPGPTLTASLVTRPDDDACLALLASGGAAGVVTAHLSPADLQVRSGFRVIGGPTPEPRSLIVPSQQGPVPDPTDLVRAIDDALAAMRADGTLARLSQSRFGGDDLTAP